MPTIAEEKMAKAFKIVTDCAKVSREWKVLAKALAVPGEDIDIVDNMQQASYREKCYNMLQRWQQAKAQRATRKLLVKKLKKLDYYDVAGKFISDPTLACHYVIFPSYIH